MKILITGGTGTIGKLLAAELMMKGHEIGIFSRDEYKQSKISMPCKKILGDIRDRESITKAMRFYDLCIHTAALKHVDIMEANINECIKTNIAGTKNVIEACDRVNAALIFLSTDKAVYPVNVYGQCKAIAEKLVLARKTRSQVIRYGNVLDSRGSIIEKFWDHIKSGAGIPITDESMTRFWVQQKTIVDYIVHMCSEVTESGLFIPPIKSASLLDLLATVNRSATKRTGIRPRKHWISGVRPGEKYHECLYNQFDNVVNKKDHPGVEAYSNDVSYLMSEDELDAIVSDQLKDK